MQTEQYQILLTNDDGIESPGLWAAAEALSPLGKVWVVAPREQATSAGRSHPHTSDGEISPYRRATPNGEMQGFAIGASPAQVIHYAIHTILPVKPQLVVSGINYGFNTGFDITRSGTIGAALEAANYGIPALAVSLETTVEDTFSYSNAVDFTVAAYFSAFFARRVLTTPLDPDIDVLKVEVPANATPQTPWEVTPLSPVSLYLPVFPITGDGRESGKLSWRKENDTSVFSQPSDCYTVMVKHQIAVTPLSLDLTSRVNLKNLDHKLHSQNLTLP